MPSIWTAMVTGWAATTASQLYRLHPVASGYGRQRLKQVLLVDS